MTILMQTLREREYSWARLVSDVLSPPVVWAALAFPICFRFAESAEQAWLWALVYTTLVCLLPVAYIAYMVRAGKIGDIHMKERHERYRPFLVSLLCTTIAWWMLRLMGAPSVLPLLALVSIVQIAIMALITLVWQISMHAMSITGAGVAVVAIFGMGYTLIILPLILLVSVSRLKLRRHTPAQIVAGALIGGLVPILVLFLAIS